MALPFGERSSSLIRIGGISVYLWFPKAVYPFLEGEGRQHRVNDAGLAWWGNPSCLQAR
jgi:hypothetical protein